MHKLGIGKVDITPPWPVPMCGYTTRTGLSERVENRLYLKAFLFQDESGAKALIVSADLIWWDPKVDLLLDVIGKRFSIPRDAILLTASHTHSGPVTGNSFSPMLGAGNDRYVDFLQQQLLHAIQIAEQDFEPVSLSLSRDECGIGINRRLQVDGVMHMRPNPKGPNDQRVSVIQFHTVKGKLKGALVHFTCHPTIKGDLSITSEYCGVAMEHLEQLYGATFGFIQGCCGDIRPALVADGKFIPGSYAEVQKLGEKLARSAISALGKKGSVEDPLPIKFGRKRLSIKFAQIPSKLVLKKYLQDSDDVSRVWANHLFHFKQPIPTATHLDIHFLQLSPNIQFMAMNGEIVVEYGLFIREITEGRCLPLGYTNGMAGYIPTDHQLQEGGYEGADAHKNFGLPSPFALGLEKKIKKMIRTLLST